MDGGPLPIPACFSHWRNSLNIPKRRCRCNDWPIWPVRAVQRSLRTSNERSVETPMAMLRAVRPQKAAELLATTTLQISQVAHAVGVPAAAISS